MWRVGGIWGDGRRSRVETWVSVVGSVVLLIAAVTLLAATVVMACLVGMSALDMWREGQRRRG